MEISINQTVAATAVAMSLLPGGAYALAMDSYDPAPYLRAYAQPFSGNLQAEGTFVNAHIIVAPADINPIDEMMRVAHMLASQSVDIDADISRFVDEEFWNLV